MAALFSRPVRQDSGNEAPWFFKVSVLDAVGAEISSLEHCYSSRPQGSLFSCSSISIRPPNPVLMITDPTFCCLSLGLIRVSAMLQVCVCVLCVAGSPLNA